MKITYKYIYLALFFLLVCDQSSPSPAEIDSTFIGKVMISSVNLIVREQPSRSSSVRGSLSPNEIVIIRNISAVRETIDSYSGNWVQIIGENGQNGFVFAPYLARPVTSTFLQAPPCSPPMTCRNVIVNNVNISVLLNSTGTTHSENSLVLTHPQFLMFENFLYNADLSFLIFVYGISFGEGSTSYISKIQGYHNIIWRTNIPGFNLGFPLMFNDHLYLTAIGFLGKINLENGVYMWTHEHLYSNGSYNNFSDIIIKEDKVYFIEGMNYPKNAHRHAIVVDDMSGRIIKVIDF